MNDSDNRAIRAIVLGAGYRGRAYAAYAKEHPDQLEIVGVADPEQAETIPAPRYWGDWRECLASRPDADVVFVTLPDALHHEAALAALDKGYHLLLEKPIATKESECREIIEKAAKTAETEDRQLIKKQTEELVASLEKEGMVVTHPDLKEFKTATASVMEMFESVYGQELLDKITKK